MLSAILIAVAIAALVIVAESLFEAGATVVTPSGRHVENKKKGWFTDISSETWTKALVMGLGVGLVSFLTTRVPAVFSLVFFAAMLYFYSYLATWWKEDGSRFKEFIPFILIGIFASFVLNQTVAMCMTAFSNTFWAWLIEVIGALVPMVFFWYCIISMMFYQEEECKAKKDREGARKKHNWALVWVVVAIILILLTLFPFFRTVSTNFRVNPDQFGVDSKTSSDGNGGWFKLFPRAGSSAVIQQQPAATSAPAATATPVATAQPSTWYRFYNTEVLNDNDPNNNFNFGPNPYNVNERAEYYNQSYRNRMRIDPALAAADMAWHDAIVGTRYLGTFYEECKGNWATTINSAKVKFMNDQKLFNQTLDAYFAFLDTADSVELRYVDAGLEDQMYMNGYTVNGVPDVIVMKTDDHDGWFLVYTFVIKGQKFEVAYRIDCGYQPTNVEKVMGITPTTPPTPPTTPPSPPPTTPPSPPPTTPPSPPPTDPPAPSYPPKDPTQGTPVGPNDDPGPGPDTNTGVGGQHSSADQPTNSDHMTHEEYVETIQELNEINQEQHVGGDSNTPTVQAPPETHVDNNGDSGTGNGGIDVSTPVSEPVHVESPSGEVTQISPDQPGEAWGGPPD